MVSGQKMLAFKRPTRQSGSWTVGIWDLEGDWGFSVLSVPLFAPLYIPLEKSVSFEVLARPDSVYGQVVALTSQRICR